MADPNVYDQFDTSPQTAPVTIGNLRPKTQEKQLKGNYSVDLNTGTATPIQGLPADTTDQRDRKQIVGNSIVDLDTGKVEPIALPGAQPFKVGDSDAINHAWDVLGSIQNARQLAGKNLATGTIAQEVTGLPIIGGFLGQNRANLQTALGQVGGDLRQLGIQNLYQQTGQHGVGTIARSTAEQQALQNSLAALGQTAPGKSDQAGPSPDEATLNKGLDQAQTIYLRHLARLYGMNPDDPNALNQLQAAYTHPELRSALLHGAPVVPTKGADNGITSSSPPPIIATPDAQIGLSTDSQMVIDPKRQALGQKIAQMVASGADRNTVLGFAVGADPTLRGDQAFYDWADKATQSVAAARKQGVKGIEVGVDPSFYSRSVPLNGIGKTRAEISGSAPAAYVVGAADAATSGAVPDIFTGFGALGNRDNLILKRDLLAEQHPTATLLGNLSGAFLPLGAAGEANALGRLGKTAAQGGAYGFFGSDQSDIPDRLLNAGLGATVAGATHGAVDIGGRALVQPAYRAASKGVQSLGGDSSAVADRFALDKAARSMPIQNVEGVTAAAAASRAAGVPAPAAASISRSGQDFLARTASGSPAARAVVDNVAAETRARIPEQLAGDFNSAIEAASPRGVDSSGYLNRPVREISSDIQGLAGREYANGIAPIAREQLTITPDVADALDHERIIGAVRDSLANHQLDPATRTELRGLIGNLRSLANAPDIARNAYAKGIPLSVDAARNIATALDRTASKLADGSEGGVELRRLSQGIRSEIADQFPEYAPVNARYASRMRAIDAMQTARQNFMASTPEQIDALNKASRNYTPEANEPEVGAAPDIASNGFEKPQKPLPSNQQLAMTGAREAATVRAGENPSATTDRLASNPNQAGNNKTVLGGKGAQIVQSRAKARANVAQTVDRIQSGGTADQTTNWFNRVKTFAAMKATGGAGHFALAHVAASVPGLSGQDAARVVRLYLDADKAPQVLQSLTRTYGARRARFIMARMAAVTASASTVRGQEH